jgi:trimeric autotransporter adhesin
MLIPMILEEMKEFRIQYLPLMPSAAWMPQLVREQIHSNFILRKTGNLPILLGRIDSLDVTSLLSILHSSRTFIFNCLSVPLSDPGVISTFAGNGTYGYSGDGGKATLATLSITPGDIAIDESGNIYIPESPTHRVRKVTVTTGIITLVAGTGTQGFGGDGGAAKLATLYSPYGVCADAFENVFIADTYNHRIRLVTKSTGIITTVAGTGAIGFTGNGGPATSATLNRPHDVAVDASGNIYIADANNNIIRVVTKSTGIITNAVPVGMVPYPESIALDLSGNIYWIEPNKNRVKMYMKSTGIAYRVAGDGLPGYTGDGGPAISARLVKPNGIALDAAGNMYICDNRNHIRKVTRSTGVITTIAGNGNDGYSGDGGQALSAGLDYTYGLVINAAGRIYLAGGDNRIRSFTVNPAPSSPTAPRTSSPTPAPIPATPNTFSPNYLSSGEHWLI